MLEDTDITESKVSSQFETTSWTLIIEAKNNVDSGFALEKLCRKYWKPIYVFCRRSGLNREDSEDASQDFFVYIFDKSWLSHVDKNQGSFRGFISTLLKYYLSNRRRTNYAQKRGCKLVLPIDRIDFTESIASTDLDASKAYDKLWARTITDLAIERLGEEQKTSQQVRRFECLKKYLTCTPTVSDYNALVVLLNEPRNTIAVALHRLIRRYGELIRLEVADTTKDTFEVDKELRYLIEIISS
jgi:DNA-directed RNA polymerase specialized sigma24 family protein